MKIDAVIPWVDGNDRALNEKRRQYGASGIFGMEDIAGDTRYANLGEIFWCVASLNRFAPFINRIYIVTDGQDPCLEERISEAFPDGHIPMEVVDHKVIFRDFEEYLPVFNSTSIESMMWRIPGLSEHFLGLNDDFIVMRPVTEADFFPAEDSVYCYADYYSTALAAVLRKLKSWKNGRKVMNFKGNMINAIPMVGRTPKFLYLRHTPRPLLRSFFEKYYSEHPDDLVRNIRYRFRDADQYIPQELHYLALQKEGRSIQVPTRDVAFYLEPKHDDEYFMKKMEKLRSGSYKFCCFNSLDKASEKCRKAALEWAEETILK